VHVRTVVATVAVVITACGARSALDVESEREPGMPRPNDCPAALAPDAPAPVPGYCPTRANRSAFDAPSVAPETRWTLDLPGRSNFTAQLAVARGNRLYAPVDVNDDDSAFIPTRLVAIDDRGDDGSIAWSVDFEGGIAGPLLLADGTLFVSVRVASGSEAVWLDERGRIRRRAALPDDVSGAPLVGADGSFFFTAVNRRADYAPTVVATDSEGGLRWRARLGLDAAALGPGDLVIAREARDGDAWVVGLDPATGAETFEAKLGDEAPIVAGPAVGPDGAIYTVVWTDASSATTLVVLEPEGTERLRVDLPDPPWGGGVTSLAIGANGVAYVKAGEGLSAIDPLGVLLFHRVAHPNLELTGVFDAQGTLLIGAGGTEAVRISDGAVLWQYEVPAHEERTPDGRVRFYFAGPATLGDGRLYFASSGGRITAASP
jgi:outer membrane protein assembly factor BamB